VLRSPAVHMLVAVVKLAQDSEVFYFRLLRSSRVISSLHNES
jgi:hypothetical protein